MVLSILHARHFDADAPEKRVARAIGRGIHHGADGTGSKSVHRSIRPGGIDRSSIPDVVNFQGIELGGSPMRGGVGVGWRCVLLVFRKSYGFGVQCGIFG